MHCEEGYLCEVCGKDVENIWESDLYLRYVLGMVDPETLHTTHERHITCNPTLGQFIVDSDFPPIHLDNDFGKQHLDPRFVEERERLVTRGWKRLKQIASTEGLSVLEYPLPEVLDRMQSRFGK